MFVLVGVSILTFFLAQVVPVDPAASALGSNAREDQIQAYRQQLGLDQPPPVQYINYMQRLLRGDLGQIDPHAPPGDRRSARLPACHH